MPECPVSCGYCCNKYSWTSVAELVKRYPAQAAKQGKDRVDCPALLKAGCGLSRKSRPKTCRMFLCDLAIAVQRKQVSLAWVWKYFDELGNDPTKVLGALLGKDSIVLIFKQNNRVQKEWEEKNANKRTG